MAKEAENALAQGIKDRIETIRQHAGMSENSTMARAAIARLEAIAIDESFAEFATEAAQAKDKALTILRADLEYCLKREAEQADLANREAIHRAIMDALTRHGIPNRYAADVVSLLATESIPFVTVEY